MLTPERSNQRIRLSAASRVRGLLPALIDIASAQESAADRVAPQIDAQLPTVE